MLYLRLAIVGAGVALFVIGDRAQLQWLTWVGIGLVAIALLLRFWPHKR